VVSSRRTFILGSPAPPAAIFRTPLRHTRSAIYRPFRTAQKLAGTALVYFCRFTRCAIRQRSRCLHAYAQAFTFTHRVLPHPAPHYISRATATQHALTTPHCYTSSPLFAINALPTFLIHVQACSRGSVHYFRPALTFFLPPPTPTRTAHTHTHTLHAHAHCYTPRSLHTTFFHRRCTHTCTTCTMPFHSPVRTFGAAARLVSCCAPHACTGKTRRTPYATACPTPRTTLPHTTRPSHTHTHPAARAHSRAPPHARATPAHAALFCPPHRFRTTSLRCTTTARTGNARTYGALPRGKHAVLATNKRSGRTARLRA